jgi:hypothetical protein
MTAARVVALGLLLLAFVPICESLKFGLRQGASVGIADRSPAGADLQVSET